ncbi:hypothetical protein CPC735_015430 [Coccidioides posadasii C735 delta SOWgp]|uniref:Uncharacterized protein n=3 Tax=Coccidioides posadasii TaxID=199306 RepID=E9D261_COCPS|nr:hypothetical protein CPC735_015430 [Coccidioides posadasii C735 delta SOWgp]EER24945.1 hypothetical protein CPC735_015430 [Coccidioides posadasii C735 delta SOWgp]EFW19275.1 conserved hypothetical protein [Coccidioides posadasii str. Silveira]KMM71738.1 hypothetical protein CPAG_08039 [Coccidioides posadasii RMSCC 3488]|eukprot:XP_003067090.1 hypothetical protein CPC735_015430 [Coccidioides posadasii C735 delta SOWgp]
MAQLPISSILGPFRRTVLNPRILQTRSSSTLQGHPHIYIFANQLSPNTHTLSLLPANPPTPELAIGTTSQLPPTPSSFVENPRFLNILQSVVSEHAHEDPDVKSQAQVMASTAGANLGSGGVFFSPQPRRKRPAYGSGGGTGGDSSGGASGQGGVGSGGRGGWIHVSDSRNPPEYGRIAWPEDIFGSLEVDGNGNIEGNGNYQPSGTYRIVTRNGILGLSPFLREKLVQRLRAEEQSLRR